MAKIVLVPTDEASKLHYFSGNKEGLYLYKEDNVIPRNPYCKNQLVYIISDDSIRENDWCIDMNKEVFQHLIHFPISIGQRKIIMTTDAKLIANGVQKIDNSFLEWYILNPTRSDIEVNLVKYINSSFPRDYYEKFKIAIPNNISLIHDINEDNKQMNVNSLEYIELLMRYNESLGLISESIDEINDLKHHYKDKGHCEHYLDKAINFINTKK